MAAITSANVTVERTWMAMDAAGAQVEVVRDLVITLTAQGGTIGDIPASALGFNKIYSVHAIGANISAALAAAVLMRDAAGTEIYPVDLTQTTDALRNNRSNITGTIYARISGSPRS